MRKPAPKAKAKPSTAKPPEQTLVGYVDVHDWHPLSISFDIDRILLDPQNEASLLQALRLCPESRGRRVERIQVTRDVPA